MSSELDRSKYGPVFSRRHLLEASSYVFAAGVVGGILADKASRHDTHQAELSAAEREADSFSEKFGVGISGSWKRVTVWPGLAVVSSDVKLFKTAELNSQTQIQWPASKDQKHLLLQRPFMARSTARANLPPKSVEDVGPQVLAFWLPNSNDLAFCDRAANLSSIPLATSSAYPDYENNVMLGEQIELEPAETSGGLVWRYMQAERVYSNGADGTPFQAEILFKACGRSLWGDPSQTASAYSVFETEDGNDIIQLPRGVQG